MKNRLTAKASLFGYAIQIPPFFIVAVSILTLQACTKHDAILNIAPKIISSAPSSNQVNVDVEASVKIGFSCAMDSASVCRSFEMTTPDGPVDGVFEFRDTAIEFIPEKDLKPNSLYTVVVARSAKDRNGQPMESDFIFYFTTKGPDEYSMIKTSEHVTDFDRDGSRIIQIGEYMYSFGGWTHTPEESYSDVYRSTDLINWEKRPDAPWHGRHVFGLVKLNQSVFVMGGDNLHPQFDVWKTDDGENWVKLADNSNCGINNRSFYGCAAHNGFLYVVGGTGVSDVWRSPDGITWTKIVDNLAFLNEENLAGSLTSFNGKLWVVCGGGSGFGTGVARKTIWSSKDGIHWDQEPDFAGSGRYYTDICVWDNKLWVVGGYNYSESNIKSIWYMTPKGQWTQLPNADGYLGRHATAVGVFNNRLVVANGSYNNDCWAIDKVQ